MRAAIYDKATGQILRVVEGPEDHIEHQAGAGQSWVEMTLGDDTTHYVDNEATVLYPPQPSPAHVFDFTSKAWVDPRTLEDLRVAKWEEMKLERNRLESEGFPYLGKVLDSDGISVQRLTTAVQAAQAAKSLGQPFSIDWTCADNSTLTMNADQMIAAPLALAAYGNHLHTTARALYALIQSLKTADAVQAVAWPS